MAKVKQNEVYHKPQQMTQKNVLIRDIVDGVVITKDSKYYKMIEVTPSPFFLKKVSEQNRIGDNFKSLLKSAPSELHLKSMSIATDLSKQIEDTKKCIDSESDLSCKKMGQEYLNKLKQAETYGINRRFFITFPFLGKTRGIGAKSFEEIKYDLNSYARRISSNLETCGNETVKYEDVAKESQAIAKLLYMFYNRDSYLKTTYEDFANERYNLYKKELGDNFYLPILDVISPMKMVFYDSKYLIINDNTYYKFLYIPSAGYNTSVITGWLNIFVNSFKGVDVDVFLKRVPKENVLTSLRRNIAQADIDLSENGETASSFEGSVASLKSARYLKDGLANGEDFYYMSTLITVSGTTPEEVNFKVDELKKSARQVDITLKENLNRNEESFNIVNPFSTWNDNLYTFKKTKRNVLTDGASSIYPFTTFNLMDDNGLYIGDDFNGSPVILDSFNYKRFTNAHIFLCGETGAGKTISIMLMALRARVKHIPVYIIVPEKEDEFRRVANAIGGQFISFGAGSTQRINIMEIFKQDESASENNEIINGSSRISSYLAEKISTLMDFFSLHIQDITQDEKSLLNEALIKTYELKGITASNNSLWADEKKTRYKQMPIISDLVKVLEESRETKRLARVIKQLTMGSGSHFDGQTNVNVNNDFFVIGLEKNSKDMVGLSTFVAMSFCADKIKEDRRKKKMFIIDEWWKMAFNPIAAEKSLAYSKLLRAFSCSMVFATQQMSDILAIDDGKFGNAVLNNCATKIIMSLQDRDVKSVAEMVDLTQAEMDSITRFKAGQGLLLAGDSRIKLQFTLSETEKLLTFTDKDSLDKYINIKKQELQKKDKEKPLVDVSGDFEKVDYDT